MPAPYLRAGTSGFAYREWRGRFYPPGLPPREMLAFYAQRFAAVEINATFYRLPTAAALQNWRAQVPAEFLFAFKAPGLITHRKRLVDVAAETAGFLNSLRTMGEQLGPVLFQLPPFLPCDTRLLRDFLAELPLLRCAFEFRHPAWFNDETYAMLRAHGCALCLSDRDGAPPPPLLATAAFGYVRLRRAQYSQAALQEWKERFAALGWRETFVFFRHEDTAAGTVFAAKLQGI